MEHRNVLITGAGGGIGSELARRYAKESGRLILVGRDRTRLERLRDELAGGGVSVTILSKDLSVPGAAAEVYEEVARERIPVHVLVNCAGVGAYGEFDRIPLERQVRMIQLNTVALTELTHLFLKDMIERRYGRVLNVASISSFLPTPLMSVYAATKAYVLSFSESLNSEVRAKGDIAVTACCPGFTKTNFIREAKLGGLEATIESLAMRPATVARAGHEAAERRKPVRIVGVANVALYVWTRILPRAWLQRAASIAFRDRSMRRGSQ
ncbi:MAG TPA: SDR family oxidoreductase [Paenibacillus sp.]|nr:SDR family oxidoreductase [Paenibacillus sp.]